MFRAIKESVSSENSCNSSDPPFECDTLAEETYGTHSNDEIQTIIGSSDSSSGHSLELHNRSGAYDAKSYGSSSFEDSGESRYLTAHSASVGSRDESESFYTATTGSRSQPRTQGSSSYNSDQFETETSDSDLTQDSRTEESEFIDTWEAQKHFLKSRIRALKTSERRSRGVLPNESTVDEGFEEVQREFINTQLCTLQRRNTGAFQTPVTNEGINEHPMAKTRKSRDPGQSDIVVPRALVEKLRIENLLHSMRKISREPFHEPQRCHSCRTMQKEALQREFTRLKYRLVYNNLTEDRFRKHVVTSDPLSLVGNLASSLPKLSDDPQKTWDQLLQKGKT